MKQKLSKQEAVILLSQMYLPWFNEKRKRSYYNSNRKFTK